MKWINASKQSPEKGDLYHTKIVMKGTGLESFPSTNNFYSGEWEVDDDYEVVEWLYDEEDGNETLLRIQNEYSELRELLESRILTRDRVIAENYKTIRELQAENKRLKEFEKMYDEETQKYDT